MNTLTFSTPFNWDGVSNLLVEICYDNAAATGSGDFVSTNTTTDDKGIWNRASTGTGCSLAAAFNTVSSTFIRPDITLTGFKPNNQVETVLNVSKTAYLGPNSDVYFYNTNGDVMARITNLSAFDYGCTQVTVDRAGTASTAFWNNNTANYLMDKTFHVVPANNNPSGQYQITLYYTAAEKAGWEAATAQSFSAIQLVKVTGQISQVTPATPAGAGAVEIATPAIGAFGSDYTLTYTFNTGFSGFAAGIPAAALPVTLLNFSGRLDNNSIPLGWSTSSEQNSAYFEVQKSTDGTHFYPLGRVTAAGSSNSLRRYGYTDKQVSELNYYRLMMTDIDGKFTWSNVVLVKSTDVQQQVWVVNNPFRSYIDVRLARLPQQQVRVELVTMGGIVAFSRAYAGAMQVRVDLGATQLSAGTYFLRTTMDGKRFVNKVVKQ